MLWVCNRATPNSIDGCSADNSAQAKAEGVSTAQLGISQILVHSDAVQPQLRLLRVGTACRRVWLEPSLSLHSYLLLHRDDKYNPVVLLPGTAYISVAATTHTRTHTTHDTRHTTHDTPTHTHTNDKTWLLCLLAAVYLGHEGACGAGECTCHR
jgi:hypothetical protein